MKEAKLGVVDGVTIPPNSEKKTFNINDIQGDLDRNEKGKLNIKESQDGEKIDKQERKVNRKGYLVDENGNIIESQSKHVMFKINELDEDGEIPSPLREERYNFNVFDVKGNAQVDKDGKPVLKTNKEGHLVDQEGREVNSKGLLVNDKGDLVNKNKRKVLDKT